MAKRYRNASKRGKGQVLDELCALTGWSRRHARRALTETPPPRRSRKGAVVYDDTVLVPLRRIWALLGAPCGKRLAPFLPEIVEVLERHGELEVHPVVRAKLVRVSAATIDRLLAPERRRMQIKGRSGTKPGTLLRNQIPIRTFADWDDARPGFCEVDLVGHDGGSAVGEYCQTLMLTDVASGWCEPRAVPNKAQRWVHEAIGEVAEGLPFPLLGLDSDNGAEFINHHLIAFCQARDVTFTRTRPYRKNDNCFVEQKNWTVVRQAVGYARYDSAAELEVLNQLYASLSPLVNFFQPQMKLVEKRRNGAKVSRRYDTATTPYRRLLASEHVTAKAKAALTRTYKTLNPVDLVAAVRSSQDRLVQIARTKENKEVRTQAPDHPWRRTQNARQRKSPSRTS